MYCVLRVGLYVSLCVEWCCVVCVVVCCLLLVGEYCLLSLCVGGCRLSFGVVLLRVIVCCGLIGVYWFSVLC